MTVYPVGGMYINIYVLYMIYAYIYLFYIHISLHFMFFPQHPNPGRLGGVGHNLLVQLPALLDEALLAIVGPESVFFPPRATVDPLP